MGDSQENIVVPMRQKVLMIIPNLGFGGAQRVFHDLSTCLNKQFEVIECVFNFDDGHAYPSTNKIYSLGVPAGKNVFQKIWYFIKRVIRLRNLKSQLQVDYAISHLEGADYINVLSAQGEKILLCIHGSKQYDTAITGIIGWIRKKILIPILYQKASKIVTVSEGIKSELIEYFRIPSPKVSVVNNGLNTENINKKMTESVGKEYEDIFDRPVLITHGRLAPEKDHRFLIELLSDVSLRNKIKLVVIGNGPLLQPLIEYANSKGLHTYNGFDEKINIHPNHNVLFLGYQSNPFVFLKRASIFVFPSLFEGFPMALLEAMACGLPVIARNCPYGPNEIINTHGLPFEKQLFAECGILISNDLSEADALLLWKSTLLKLLDDNSIILKYKQQSWFRAADFDIKYFCERWSNVLSSLQ